VAFLDGGAPISSCSSQPVTAANGSSTATCTVSYASGGSHTISASFSGGPDFLASTSAAQKVTVLSPPSVSFSSPSKNARYIRGQKVLARYRCHEGAGGPGIRSCVGSAAVGKPIDTSRLGLHAFKVTATSIDGEVTMRTAFYTVRPSNRLTRVRRQPNSDGTFIVTAKAPGPGRVDILITAWKDNFAGAARLLNPAPGRFVFARAHAKARRAGTLTVVVAPGARGRQLIAHPRYQITLRLWISYTPTHGRQRDIGYYGLHLP
jgi:hypothetical protein